MKSADETSEDEPVRRDPFFLRRRRDKFRKKLDDLLGKAEDEAFLRMLWAADALEQGKAAGRAWFTTRPPNLVKVLSDRRIFHKWTLETLANELLATRKSKSRGDRANRSLDCHHLSAAMEAVNLLNELENAEDGMVLRRLSVFAEMHRLTQRQFPWQRGKVNISAFYKSWALYGFPKAQAHFLAKNDIGMAELSIVCFGLYSLLQDHSGCVLPMDFSQLGIDRQTVETALSLVSADLDAARKAGRDVRKTPHHTSYRRSILRETPLIRFPRYIIAPIPALLIERITSGLYYDLVDAGGAIRDQIARRFEVYCRELFEGYLQDITVLAEFKYRNLDSPDVLLVEQGKLVAAVECKAKKEPISAKFAEEHVALASPGIDELAKGIFQIWRFFSHVRKGRVLQTPVVDSSAVGILLMLDTWLEASDSQREAVLLRAQTLADKQAGEILEEDRKPIVFCQIDDLERLLMVTTDADFRRTLALASASEHQGWHLEILHEKLEGRTTLEKPDPFADRIESTIQWLKIFSREDA